MSIRNYLFEFEDLPWFPNTIREGMTDYLRYLLTHLKFYQPVTPLLQELLIHSESNRIIDLCSGGGGAIQQVSQNLNEGSKTSVKITLTDKFPNLAAFRWIGRNNPNFESCETPVDATFVPKELVGVRTIFSGFHHFEENEAKKILRDASDNKQPIGIFDGGDKNLFSILGILFFHPLAFMIFTPLFRPFRWSRLIFTYLVPLIPLCTVWDGVVSMLRLYHPHQLQKMANEINHSTYVWKSGKLKSNFGLHVSFLIGYPGK